MKLIDFVIIGVILVIVALAAWYVIRAKKRGAKCIGCPSGDCCCSKSAQGQSKGKNNVPCSCSCGGCASCTATESSGESETEPSEK